MKFRLTYSGPLRSSGNEINGKLSDHKHDLRLSFNPQLRRLWETMPFLKTGKPTWPTVSWAPPKPEPNLNRGERGNKYKIEPWNFVPLVTEDMGFYCSVDILILRTDGLTAITGRGDLDGRIKTLLDALSMPLENHGYPTRQVSVTANPLHVLFENDRQISKISVETDHMLEPLDASQPSNFKKEDTRILINVAIGPIEPSTWSLPFI